MPPLVATLATNQSYQDLKIFLTSLSLWYTLETAPTVYLFCDAEIMTKVLADKYPIYILFNECLDNYSGKNRNEMEAVKRPGNKTLWYEFQMEKLNLLDWVFSADPELANKEGVFFLDADLCFFGKLPEIPNNATVALSPHMIRERDENRFGKYNGGCLWMRDHSAVKAWREACPKSRFHEQAALECFDEPKWSNLTYYFPVQMNYGWWRMYQGRESASELQSKWRNTNGKITVENRPLISVHTHFFNPLDMTTRNFNEFVIKFVKEFHEAKVLLELLKFE